MFTFIQMWSGCALYEQTCYKTNKTTGTLSSREKLGLCSKIEREQDRKPYKYTCTYAYT